MIRISSSKLLFIDNFSASLMLDDKKGGPIKAAFVFRIISKVPLFSGFQLVRHPLGAFADFVPVAAGSERPCRFRFGIPALVFR